MARVELIKDVVARWGSTSDDDDEFEYDHECDGECDHDDCNCNNCRWCECCDSTYSRCDCTHDWGDWCEDD